MTLDKVIVIIEVILNAFCSLALGVFLALRYEIQDWFFKLFGACEKGGEG